MDKDGALGKCILLNRFENMVSPIGVDKREDQTTQYVYFNSFILGNSREYTLISQSIIISPFWDERA